LEILNSSGEGGVFDGARLTQSLKAIGTNIFGLMSVKVNSGGGSRQATPSTPPVTMVAVMRASVRPQIIEGASAAVSRPFDFRLLTMSAFEPDADDGRLNPR
jgi:hypothetical protein